METRIRYDFKTGIAIGTGPETARVLIGSYVGLPNGEEPDVFDLYRMDDDGEPVGERQGQMRSTISEVTVAAEKE
jgi:hypothetical protein